MLLKPPRGAQPNRTHWAQRGLLGLWLMNEGTGNKVWDYSGKQNHGTLVGGSRINGKFGSAINIVNTSDRITISSDFVKTSDITFITWFYSIQNVEWCRFISNGKFDFYRNTYGQLRGSSDGFITSASTVDWVVYNNVWSCVCLTRNITGVMNFYVNNVQKEAANQNSGTPVDGNTNIGLLNTYGGDRQLTGITDHIRIYNRILSAAERSKLYLDPFCDFKEGE